MKRSLLLPVLASCGLASLSTASAQNFINFEPPAYNVGAFSPSSGNAAPAFNGQQGWSASTSTDAGQILTVTSSGSYVGGQALSTVGNANTYIGAKNTGLAGGFTSFSMNVQGSSSFAGEVYAGGWADANNDNAFVQTEAALLAGLVSTGTAAGAPLNFGFRPNNFGNRIATGVAPVIGNWYSLTIGLNYATLTATLDAVNLTTNTVVDLNGAAAGNQYSVSLTAAGFGANPATYKGVVARVSDNSVLDNVAVPEPTTWAMLTAAGLGAAVLRRRRQG